MIKNHRIKLGMLIYILIKDGEVAGLYSGSVGKKSVMRRVKQKPNSFIIMTKVIDYLI